MDARQRLFATLRGEPTPETPIWLLFPHHRLGCYVDVMALSAYAPVVRMVQERCITLDRRSIAVRCFAPEVEERHETQRDGDTLIRRRTLTWRGHRLTEERCTSPQGDSHHALLVDDDDLDLYLSLPLNDDPRAIRAELEAHLPQLRAERATFPLALGATMFALGEPINPLYHDSNLESFACWSLTHDPQIVDWLDRRMRTCREVYRWCLEQDLAEVYFLISSELAAPPLVGVGTFARWIVPYSTELVAMIRDAGRFVIQHFHGQIRRLLPYFRGMAPHALHTIEAPPIGDCTITQAYDGLGTGIALIGNVQYDELRSLTPATMHAQVTRLLDEVAGRPFICSPTAGPFDPQPAPRVIENYLALIEAAWDYGRHRLTS